MAKFSLHFLSLSLLLLISVQAASDPILSCSQTPYPQVCSSMISTPNSQLFQDKSRVGFRDLLFQATMYQASLALARASSMNLGSLNARAKAAWADCLELAEDTIQLLNRSMASSTANDAQTWLSAAIANQETCRNGFIELNSPSNVFQSSPFSANNISESISNTLAINKAMAPVTSGGNRRLLSRGFPNWVSTAERKLLQSSTVKANLVVAQDGSGDYKTISEAVAASVKLKKWSMSRFIIRVKAGTYTENVEVEKTMKNLMIVGDGIDKTIVTGSKNVQDGSTTFRSATFGESSFVMSISC